MAQESLISFALSVEKFRKQCEEKFYSSEGTGGEPICEMAVSFSDAIKDNCNEHELFFILLTTLTCPAKPRKSDDTEGTNARNLTALLCERAHDIKGTFKALTSLRDV